jgi:hypothetical protein
MAAGGAAAVGGIATGDPVVAGGDDAVGSAGRGCGKEHAEHASATRIAAPTGAAQRWAAERIAINISHARRSSMSYSEAASYRPGAWAWVVAALAGALGAGLLVHAAAAAHGFAVPELALGIFVMALAVLLVLPGRKAAARLAAGAVAVTALAIAFDWIAFAPGERSFRSVAAMGGMRADLPMGETTGRIMFGAFAVLADVAAIGLWLRLMRRVFGPAGER